MSVSADHDASPRAAAQHDASPRAATQHDGRVAPDVSRDTSHGTGAARQLSRDDRAATPPPHGHPMVETLRYRAIMAGLPLLRALHRARS